MSKTTYFDIDLPSADNRDWSTVLNDVLSKITEKMVRTQLPAGTTLRWGDIAGGKYLEVSTQGVRVIGGLNHGLVAGSSFRIPQGEDFPGDPGVGEMFLRTDEDILYRWNCTSWLVISGVDASILTALGALMVSDLGEDKGSYPVSDGAGGIEHVVPGGDGTVPTSDSTQPNGWSLRDVMDLLGLSLSAGQIPIGAGGDTAEALSPGADGELLVSDSAQTLKVKWQSVVDMLATLLTSKGQLIGRSAGGPVAVPAPAANGQVLIGDSAAVSGTRWAPQSELGAVPGVGTRAAADLFNYYNFI